MQALSKLHQLTYAQVNMQMEKEGLRRELLMDKRHGVCLETESIPVGTEVFVREHAPDSKLDARFRGPFFVVRVNQAGNYVLKDAQDRELTRSVPRNHIKVTRQGLTESGATPVEVVEFRDTVLGREVMVRHIQEQAEGVPMQHWIEEEALVDEVRADLVA